jgi:hypothetical protein
LRGVTIIFAAVKKSIPNKPLPPDVSFDSLVRNAIDFLEKSVHELEKHPKYSVIHFHMALELFLKARLLCEHWSLVVSKTEKASVQSFQSGDFNSVTMEECIQRLSNIANESLQSHEHECFKVIRERRNKLVHFFHSDYQSPIDEKILAEIVSEQCKAWFYLHRLLTVKWKTYFAGYQNQVAGLQKLLHKNQHFLVSKFKALAPEIELAKKNGTSFFSCSLCGHEAAQIIEIQEPLFKRQCLVCNWRVRFLKLSCPTCGKPVTVEAEGKGECGNCETSIGFEVLMEKFGPYQNPKEEGTIARCSNCENFEPSVIPFEERYLCLNCFTLHNEVGQCDFCSELITGDISDTGITGCFCCDGPDFGD